MRAMEGPAASDGRPLGIDRFEQEPDVTGYRATQPPRPAGPRPAAPELRPYQLEVVGRIEAEFAAGRRRVLLVAPTGSGKTLIAATVIGDAVKRGERVLFLAHRRELIFQCSLKLHDAGLDHGVILAGHPMRLNEPIQVASIATLHRRAVASSTIELPAADLVVVDEAHHARARTWQRLLDAYPEANILGMTATPCRGDGRGLGNVFGILVECPLVAELIGLGFLVPTRVFAPSRPDLKGVRVERGDYVETQLAERMNRDELVGDIIEHWHRLSERRKTVIFATGVAHSVHLRDEFRRSGVWAEHIDASTPAEERDAILARLADGSIEIVCNAMILSEGWDQPEVSCIVLARPTRQLGLYRQMVGRVLRPAPGKTDALVLDHAGAVFEHGFAEDPIEWTLATDKRAKNPVQASRDRGLAPALTTCPECSAIHISGKPCPECGWRPQPKPVAVEVAEGELAMVDRARRIHPVEYSPTDKARFYRQLLWIARDRRYRDGWAAHQFKAKFRTWPDSPPWQRPMPEVPDDAVRAWVRSRQIAYAKAMAKQRSAAA